jgi:hypothetical protein
MNQHPEARANTSDVEYFKWLTTRMAYARFYLKEEPDKYMTDIRAFLKDRPQYGKYIDLNQWDESLRQRNRSKCIDNLRHIQHAKERLRSANPDISLSHVPTKEELDYFKQGFPTCPGGGAYSINDMTNPPTCSLHDPPYNHILP